MESYNLVARQICRTILRIHWSCFNNQVLKAVLTRYGGATGRFTTLGWFYCGSRHRNSGGGSTQIGYGFMLAGEYGMVLFGMAVSICSLARLTEEIGLGNPDAGFPLDSTTVQFYCWWWGGDTTPLCSLYGTGIHSLPGSDLSTPWSLGQFPDPSNPSFDMLSVYSLFLLLLLLLQSIV